MIHVIKNYKYYALVIGLLIMGKAEGAYRAEIDNDTGLTIYYRLWQNGKQCWPSDKNSSLPIAPGGKAIVTWGAATSCAVPMYDGITIMNYNSPTVSIDVNPFDFGINQQDDKKRLVSLGGLASNVLKFTIADDSVASNPRYTIATIPIPESSDIYTINEKQFKDLANNAGTVNGYQYVKCSVENITGFNVTGGPSTIISSKLVPTINCVDN